MASATGRVSEDRKGRAAAGSVLPANPGQQNHARPRDNRRNCAIPMIGEATLTDLIEGEVIPRLMFAYSHCGDVATASLKCPSAAIRPAEATRFAPLALDRDADDLLKEVEIFLDRGVSVEEVLVELLAPSARRLGQMWETDDCDFLDVTIGLWRLQEVMREISRKTPSLRATRANPPSALFSPMPGETHSFGSLMVEEVFAKAGWRSEVLLEPQRGELLKVVAGQPLDLVGLTVSCDCHSADLSELIAAIRSVSKSPTTKIFIGGRMVNAHPELVEQCGADGTAPDAISALALAERMITEPQSRSSSTV